MITMSRPFTVMVEFYLTGSGLEKKYSAMKGGPSRPMEPVDETE